MSNTEAQATNRWLPVVGGVAMNLALGSLYAWSVFVSPLEAEFGWSRTDVTWVFQIAIVTFALSFVLAGRIQDRLGPRIPAAIGGTLVGLGFILASFTSSLTFLYFAFGFLVGMGNGFGYATPIPVGSKWFPDKRGLVVGLMVAGYGGGSAIFGPLGNALIARFGWRPTFQIIGVILFLMCMVGTWLLKNPPAGYQPEGWSPQAAPAERTLRDIPTGEMVGKPTFYALWVAFCLGTTAGLMIISQLAPFAASAGLTGTGAALAIFTVGALGSSSGRIASGWMSDIVGRLTTLRIMILVSAIAMPALFLLREQAIVLYVLIFVVYWCFGTQLSVFATTAADFFGTKHMGLNYGLLFTAYGVAGLIGPYIAGRVFDRFDSYQYAFFIAAGLAVVALISLALARPPSREAVSAAT
jgi:OFA family oxalate/formate antiporter-like MFS transporter